MVGTLTLILGFRGGSKIESRIDLLLEQMHGLSCRSAIVPETNVPLTSAQFWWISENWPMKTRRWCIALSRINRALDRRAARKT